MEILSDVVEIKYVNFEFVVQLLVELRKKSTEYIQLSFFFKYKLHTISKYF